MQENHCCLNETKAECELGHRVLGILMSMLFEQDPVWICNATSSSRSMSSAGLPLAEYQVGHHRVVFS